MSRFGATGLRNADTQRSMMKFEELPFEERVRGWFGPDPVAEISKTLAPYRNGDPGLHMNGLHGAYTEPGDPPVGVALSSRQEDTFSWIRFHMVHDGAAYVEELMPVEGWDYTRVAEEAQAWRRAVQRGDKEAQRIRSS